MVKLAGPCFSQEASGKLGGALVFSRWKGRAYARSLVTPANPRSGNQTGRRAMWAFLAQEWAGLSEVQKASYEDLAESLSISPFNAYVRFNQRRWNHWKAPSAAYPAAESDTLPTLGALSAVGGTRSAQITQAVTTAADGWAVAFFRSPTGTFDSAISNLVHVAPISGTDPVVFVDSPLDPGTYYYDTRAISLEGKMSAETGEAATDPVVS
jgi:hypothetical protein